MNPRNLKCFVDDAKSLSMSVSSQAGAVPTLQSILASVRRQVEVEYFEGNQRAQAEELCLIIAEVQMLPPGMPVRIAGSDLPAELAAEFYQRLTHEHLELVIENYNRVTYHITAKKTYLRTALYNAVFECEFHCANQVAKLLAGK